MKVYVSTGASAPDSAYEPNVMPEEVFLRAVATNSGDGLAIEVALNSDFSDAERVVKVGTIGANGALAVKRYGVNDRVQYTEDALDIDGDGLIAESFKSPGQ